MPLLNSDMPKILRSAKIVWIIFCFLPIKVLASLDVPRSYAILSADNQFMLVMCSPIKTNYDSGLVFTIPSGKQINLREQFKTNGIYRLDNFQCVQSLDWFAEEGDLFTSEDFSILIRLNSVAVETQNNTNWSWCLKFYNKGKEVKQYKVKDLVAMPHVLFLPETSYGWHSVWHETEAFTSGAGLYPLSGSYSSQWQFILVTEPQFFGQIKLSDGNIFVFNPFTGEIIQQWRHHPLIKFLAIVILFLSLCVLALLCCVKIFKKLFRKLWPKKV
jgi:hypothetical protein